jgi:hypothetical protein
MCSLGEREVGSGNSAMGPSDSRFFEISRQEAWFLVTEAEVIA